MIKKKTYNERIKRKVRTNTICQRCNYEWLSSSLMKYTKCPNCDTSVKIPFEVQYK